MRLLSRLSAFCLAFSLTACGPDDVNGNWMANYQEARLNQLTLVNSHDAGMFKPYVQPELTACKGGAMFNIAVTQEYDIEGQLKSGARSFDVRPVVYLGRLYTAHGTKEKIDAVGLQLNAGCRGQALDSMFNQIKSFLDSHPKEVVMLHVSHADYAAGMFSSVSGPDVMERVKVLAASHLGNLLFRPQDVPEMATISDITQLRLKDFVSSNRRVIVDVECQYVQASRGFVGCAEAQASEPVKGVLAGYTGSWANSPMAATVIARVEQSYANYRNSGASNGFDLSWTATQDNSCIAGSFSYKLFGRPLSQAPSWMKLLLDKAGIGTDGYDHCRSIRTMTEPLQEQIATKFAQYRTDGTFCPNRRPALVSLDFVTPSLANHVISLNDPTTYSTNPACPPSP